MNAFEDQLTEGVATYIHRFHYFPETQTFEMVLFHQPNSSSNFRVLNIDQIKEYQDIPIDEFDPLLTESIIGADQQKKDGDTQTFFHTDLREITIKSSGNSDIKRIEPFDSPKGLSAPG